MWDNQLSLISIIQSEYDINGKLFLTIYFRVNYLTEEKSFKSHEITNIILTIREKNPITR